RRSRAPIPLKKSRSSRPLRLYLAGSTPRRHDLWEASHRDLLGGQPTVEAAASRRKRRGGDEAAKRAEAGRAWDGGLRSDRWWCILLHRSDREAVPFRQSAWEGRSYYLPQQRPPGG